jgi:hypothetical protein
MDVILIILKREIRMIFGDDRILRQGKAPRLMRITCRGEKGCWVEVHYGKVKNDGIW